jgi:multidrug efflux pump subunit AcrA (membrane-fusion protein)
MKLEASVPSDDLSTPARRRHRRIHGARVRHAVPGRIERIAPQADAATRQVPIYVAIPNVGGRLVAGLFAEGRVVSQSASGIVVPSNAVNTIDPSKPWVLRVTDGKTERVNVTLGLRDPRSELVNVASGLNEGDVLLRGASQGITPGTPVKVSTTK